MSRGLHIAPHRLADAISGRTSGRERARVERHVASCERCADARERLQRARLAMTDIAEQPAPDLGWDHIGVRVYWSTSSARHRALREGQESWWRQPPLLAALSALGLAAAAGFALTVWSAQDDWSSAPSAASPVAHAPAAPAAGQKPMTPAPPATPAVPVAPAAPARATAMASAPLRGVVTFASGEVSVDGARPRPDVDIAALFASAIVEGAQLRTGEGRLVIQFGQDSGLALPPGSSVRLRRFDERAVEIAVEQGAVEVEVSHRRMDQTLSVVAGRHRVSVLGTKFRVANRAGDLEVKCARGQVVISDGDSAMALSVGEQLEVVEQSLLARALRQAIDRQRLAVLERDLAQPLLPAWTESPALFDTSSTVALDAPAGRAVRLDKVRVGAGSFALRVMSGRHHVQVASAAGVFEQGAWIDARPRAREDVRAGQDGVVRVLTAGAAGAPTAVSGGATSPSASRSASLPESPSSIASPSSTASPSSPMSIQDAAAGAARRLRRGQLDRAVKDSPRARQCTSPLAKRDLVAGSYVLFDVGVNSDGSQGHLNVVRSNVPPDVERCLRGVVDAAALPVGPEATVRFKLAF